jgi:hypothetical protein
MRTRRFLRRGSWLAAVAVFLLQLGVWAHGCDRADAAVSKCHAAAAAAGCKMHCDASTPTAGGGPDDAPPIAPKALLPEAAFPPVAETPRAIHAAAPPAPPPAYILLQSYRS